MKKDIPILIGHNTEKVVGVIKDATVVGDKICFSGIIDIYEFSKSGIQMQAVKDGKGDIIYLDLFRPMQDIEWVDPYGFVIENPSDEQKRHMTARTKK